ncbi:MAG TPA: hypothetical protein VHR67_08995 [Aestuariivirgaceae bacterium]|nr:hypothetical protein [Aestuariivirgaceae bacterium]
MSSIIALSAANIRVVNASSDLVIIHEVGRSSATLGAGVTAARSLAASSLRQQGVTDGNLGLACQRRGDEGGLAGWLAVLNIHAFIEQVTHDINVAGSHRIMDWIGHGPNGKKAAKPDCRKTDHIHRTSSSL